MGFGQRHRRKVWLYVVVGIAIGRHSWLCTGCGAGWNHGETRMVVGARSCIGWHTALFQCGRRHPIVSALMEKGASLGTVLAFMMSVVGLSLPRLSSYEEF